MSRGKFWGGRFKKNIDSNFFRFQQSISVDWPLAEYDVYHSLVHIDVLKKEGIITSQEASKLQKALKNILKSIEKGKFKPSLDSEDIHTDIHNKVKRQLPKIADKLHSLRSRNDQVAFDEKFFVRTEAKIIADRIRRLENVFKKKARAYREEPFISYTHTQRAQVIYFSQYLLGWYEFFSADERKLRTFAKNIKLSLGAGAGSGTSLSQKYYQESLRGINLSNNSIESLRNPLYAVSDRDFLIEFIFLLTLFQMHLSRLCEDFIMYSSREFDYILLPEEFCTGSSLMPHKKNADFLELVRGNTAIVYGNLNAIFVLLKALPLTYNRDLQLDKNILFTVLDIIKKELDLFPPFIEKISLKKENIKRVLTEDYSIYATELAELLVRKGVPFSRAHKIIGRLIVYLEKKGKKLTDLSTADLKNFHPYLKKGEVENILNPAYVLKKRSS